MTKSNKFFLGLNLILGVVNIELGNPVLGVILLAVGGVLAILLWLDSVLQ